MTAISAGWGKEDDCVMTRLYLPNGHDLVTQQTKATKTSEPPQLEFRHIEHLLIGVHAAVISEAMTFCAFLQIDRDIMFDIVSNAAGSSAMFKRSFKSMQERGFQLAGVPNAELVIKQLVSMVSNGTSIQNTNLSPGRVHKKGQWHSIPCISVIGCSARVLPSKIAHPCLRISSKWHWPESFAFPEIYQLL